MENINYSWGSGYILDTGKKDDIYLDFVGFIKVPETKTYIFRTRSDDGVRFMFNGKYIINRWRLQGATYTTSSEVTLEKDKYYPINLNWYEHKGGAVLQLEWKEKETKIADERRTMDLDVETEIKYGARGKFVTKKVGPGKVKCDNRVFGDPYRGVFKACYTKEGGSGWKNFVPVPEEVFFQSKGTSKKPSLIAFPGFGVQTGGQPWIPKRSKFRI